LGATQILAWGSTYYLLAVLANPIAETTGWPLSWIMGGLSLGLLTSGLIAPRVGRAIERHGGRPVLAVSAMLIATGLLCLSLSAGLAAYLLSWIVIGLGMGCGLYDSAFATLGRLYREEARIAITTLTLWGGFASTVCWPLTAMLVERVGWQNACIVYAGLHLTLALPLYLFALPREARLARPAMKASRPALADSQQPANPGRTKTWLFVTIATAFTVSAAIGSVISAHLLILLQAREIALAGAVALGALIGPSQVGARVIELLIGRRFHPVATLMAATALIAAGLAVQLSGLPIIAVGLILYGAGIGIMSIVRGTLPLALFGASGFATLIGHLAMPSLVAQSLSPIIAAILLDRFDATATLWVLMALGLANVALAAMLAWQCRPSRR
jgi:MFS family permease